MTNQNRYGLALAVEATDPALDEVMTLAEASRVFFIDPRSIMMQIYKGRIAARQAGGIWLVSRASMARRWGIKQPQKR